MGGIVDCGFQYLPRVRGASREQIDDGLKAWHQPVKALQERVMQIAGDPAVICRRRSRYRSQIRLMPAKAMSVLNQSVS